MNNNPLNKGMIEKNSVGIGQVSTVMVEERAEELALIAGHSVTQADSEQALRELTGGCEMDDKQLMLESLSEDDRWNLVPGSIGHRAEVFDSEEEDENGRSQGAQLIEEGVSEAAHDQMLQAALAAEEKDLFDQ